MLAFAPYVQECIGIDATQEMVDVASSFAEEKAAVNVHFQKGTASDEARDTFCLELNLNGKPESFCLKTIIHPRRKAIKKAVHPARLLHWLIKIPADF